MADISSLSEFKNRSILPLSGTILKKAQYGHFEAQKGIWM
jgi:hypothetical protein